MKPAGRSPYSLKSKPESHSFSEKRASINSGHKRKSQDASGSEAKRMGGGHSKQFTYQSSSSSASDHNRSLPPSLIDPSTTTKLNVNNNHSSTPPSPPTVNRHLSFDGKESSARRIYFPSVVSPRNPIRLFNQQYDLMFKQTEEEAKYRTIHLFQRHPHIQPRMRAILLDWMTEVCDVYKLHRETYYISVEFVDRYLSQGPPNLSKDRLQLLGITALFSASKLEEIYPPKCEEFAFVTDGACSDDQVRAFELILMKVLDWRLNPVTVTHWISYYVQILSRLVNYGNTVSPSVLASCSSASFSPSQPPSTAVFSHASVTKLSSKNPNILKPSSPRNSFTATIGVPLSTLPSSTTSSTTSVATNDENVDSTNLMTPFSTLKHNEFINDDRRTLEFHDDDGTEGSSIVGHHHHHRNLVGGSLFHTETFIHLSRLSDLCVMDEGCLMFPTNVIAASVFLSLIEDPRVCIITSGMKDEELRDCMRWVEPMLETVLQMHDPSLRTFSELHPDDWHNIQTHTICLRDFNDLCELKRRLMSQASPMFRQTAKNGSGKQQQPNILGGSRNVSVGGTASSSSASCLYPTPPPSNERH